MSLSSQEAYDQAYRAYVRYDYKEALRLLDRHWNDIYAPVKGGPLGKKLCWLRGKCRDLVASNQAQALLVPSPTLKRKNRRLSREQRNQRRRKS